jgi:hypothetical protein
MEWRVTMKATLPLIAVLVATACVTAAHAESEGGLRLRYSLTDRSSIALQKLNRPATLKRSLSGTFNVIVRQRFPGGFVFEITDLRFRSVEDDLYERVEADAGVLTFNDPNIPDPRPNLQNLNLDLTMSVKLRSLEAEEDEYHANMTGENRELLATTWPPVFSRLVLLGADFREPYLLNIFAEAHFCPADCNQDGASTLDELVTCLNVALGIAESGTCPTCDLNGDGSVSIDEVVTSVDTVLHGCE